MITWNPFTDNLDFTGNGPGTLTIPEYDSDPLSPVSNQAWVLNTTTGGGGGNVGQPIGLLLALTQAGTGAPTTTYQFSYYTTEGTIVRTTLS